MSSSKPYVAQWGIIGCGCQYIIRFYCKKMTQLIEDLMIGISSEFVKDACRPMNTRNVTDVSHAIAAVGSRSLEKAEDFINKYCPAGGAAQQEGLVQFKPKACGSYKAVVEDAVSSGFTQYRILILSHLQNVDIVYVGTLNTCHYDDAKLVLEAGKPCLLEKVRFWLVGQSG